MASNSLVYIANHEAIFREKTARLEDGVTYMFSYNDILQGNDGKVQIQSAVPADPALLFRSAQHDSRQVGPGDLFVAIKGARVDGHTYIPAVARAGALGALCTEPAVNVPPHFLQFVVPDVVEALIATARVRASRQQQTTMIGITGSNGKTTTKEAVAAVLSQQFSTLKTYASYNNEVGLPLTILSLEPQHRYAVLEMGAERVGEIAWLCSIVRPNWAIVTSVGTAHLRTFGSLERIAIAKSELVQALPEDGIAILNYDDPQVRAMSQKTRARVIYYGLDERAEVRATDITGNVLKGYAFTLHYHDVHLSVQLQIPGKHGISTALAAAATGFLAGIDPNAICSALSSITAVKGRGQIKRGPNGSTLIDDTYKANRESMLTGIDIMNEASFSSGGKRWAVLGDMVDFGEYSRGEHYAIGQGLAGKVDYLVAIGDEARFYVEGAQAAGLPASQIYYFEVDPTNSVQFEAAKQSVASFLLSKVQSNDLLFVKASNPLHLHTILENF
jgi:UDP-N-acetylmuramoyl-tripeptide--D-alanyl-D-alanine ligase